MIVHFFIGLILMTHPGRAIETIIASPPQGSHAECEENLKLGLKIYARHYEPIGWEIKNIYCSPIAADDSLRPTI